MSEPEKMTAKVARVESCKLDILKCEEEVREASDKLEEAYSKHSFEIKGLRHALEFKKLELSRNKIWLKEAEVAKEQTFDGTNE